MRVCKVIRVGNEEKKDRYMVVIPDRIRKQIEGAPEEVQEDIEKLIKGFVDGTINPKEVGESVSDEEWERLQNE